MAPGCHCASTQHWRNGASADSDYGDGAPQRNHQQDLWGLVRQKINGMSMRSIWMVGDIQGCCSSLDELLAHPEIAQEPLARLKAHLSSTPHRVLVIAESQGRRESLLDFVRSSGLTPPVFDSLEDFLTNGWCGSRTIIGGCCPFDIHSGDSP